MRAEAAVMGTLSAAHNHAMRAVSAFVAAVGEFVAKAIAAFLIYGLLGWVIVVAAVIRLSGADHWISWIVLGVLATALHLFFTLPAIISFCVMAGVRAAVRKLGLGEAVLDGLAFQIFGANPDLADRPLEELDEAEVRAAADAAAAELKREVGLLGRVRRFVLRRVFHRAVKIVLGEYLARVHSAILDGGRITLRDVTTAVGRTIDEHLADQLATNSKRVLTGIVLIEACVVVLAPLPLRWLPI
ncbi:MAG: hypothetical protein DHS20C14_09570 [Phycisphaeraceae bacterium]|nr:MAG: hypothetical protein DHS20C14_09570 [Phycisphaeraceae bacterium]